MTKQRSELDATIPSTLVMAEMPQPRETFVLIRGAYNKKGEKVTAGVPAILPPLPMDAPPNRLGLARWLVDPGHPLTARVTVNRFWQQCFGHGLVRTANDFGAQGEPPTHPDLLDWLASEFVAPTVASAKPWDVKHLMRLMVTSYTYRQASRVTPELQRRDPENGLLARGPRFRMDAEVVRDMALATSGLLADKIGGKSVKPYQPPGLWEAVGFVGSNTREFRGESGEALYRRSMYTFWKRTCPPPSRDVYGPPRPHQYPPAGARTHERRAVRRGRSAPGPPHDRRRRLTAPRPAGLRIPADDGPSPRDPRNGRHAQSVQPAVGTLQDRERGGRQTVVGRRVQTRRSTGTHRVRRLDHDGQPAP
jgi:hypothetical protein